ncbi:Polyadenylate-binding protein [Heracleum sosnowskyi]|uniref:Polyadenylate-binding protein n=1 Tax=Heracleum sosnowskyi TaxID=360622 RepID=A0AAD8JK43_9APIA|nr:Polyadenylate-binding protein [Heracleum sosnowskyi]KAK1403947.1 Polyadenylate-binding protein [Heracleum sosnowskyi]
MAAAATVVGAASGGGAMMSNNVSLYVGDLDKNVGETQLYDLFNQVGQVMTVRVCRDLIRSTSLGYGYVNFSNPQDAAHARDVLNFTNVNGKPIRIMYCQRDPSMRKCGFANVFIKNLDKSIDNKALQDTFASFGTVLSCKVALDSSGKSRGFGFVQFDQEEAAQYAIKQLNGMLMNDKQVYVGLFIRKQDRSRASDSQKFTNVYVKNLPDTVSDEEFRNMFEKFGLITSAVVMKDADGKSRCFGFVNFQNFDNAAAAVENMNGVSCNEKVLYVGKAQRKSEREAELRAKFEQERISRFEKLKGANLYLKNLDDTINEEKLKDLFSKFGTITSCKVNLDPQGISKGSGFVAFSNPDDAAVAMNEMNGTMVGKKPLYVAVAHRKDERRAHLQAQFAQIRAPGAMAPLPAGMPGFHPGAPRLPQQSLYYGQGTPGLMPPQLAGYGFQQQLVPGIRPGIPPNFVMPPYQFQRQGPSGQRMGQRRNGNTQQMQQQWMPRSANNGFSRYMANGRNGDAAVVPQAVMGQMMPLPMDGSVIAPPDPQRAGPVPKPATLSSALASANPANQRVMLGEHLYPLVQRLEQEHAGKVTGMLLEMDQTEVLHLIESPDALKKKVAEAMDVLRLANTAPASDVAENAS